MIKSPKSDLASFSEGMALLARRPLASLALAAAGMVLAALPPLLQIKVGLPDDDVVRFVLTFACLIPLEMYVIPRFLAEADASRGDRTLNPPAGWAHLFEERWMPAMAARILLYAGVFLGMVLLIVPGLMILFAFGWAPLRVLLRGEPLPVAARGSLRMMVRAWRRVMLVVLALAALYLAYMAVLALALTPMGEAPTPWVRLTHPGMWVGNFFGTLLNLWTSTTVLALFRRVEGFAGEPAPGD
ncbi:hypothetical protein [Mesoterricola silvestris]|uniref:Uncharacterized protein n=1 Tax=Mesoterricola silvestris TaxID=2927979 RepID=A0AA48GLD9_9BACT|nr:hypothetical protein [Mesoterricola silvestris]BDU73527.1 hypothetical protein METEAL_27010 [Mesoterricola silvestris]